MIDLETIGITKQELQDRVVARIAEGLLTEWVPGDPEEGEPQRIQAPSRLEKAFRDLIGEQIKTAVNALAEKTVLPIVSGKVEDIVMQETNKWGEKTGQPCTFREYLVQRAEAWITEPTDFQGKGRGERGSYSWEAKTTRIAYMIHEHLQYEIQSAIQKALADLNSNVAKGIHEAVKIKLDEALAGLKVETKIRSPRSKLYPCKPDIFAATYEPAEETP